MQKVFQVYGPGRIQREIWGDGSTVHHPNYVADIRREDNELMSYVVHRLDAMYYSSINAISFFLCQMEAGRLFGGVRHVNPFQFSLFVILAENIKERNSVCRQTAWNCIKPT